MTRSELIDALGPGRLPGHMLSLQIGDILLLIALGLCTAALLGLIAQPFLRTRPSRAAQIRASRGQPAPERLLTLARLLGSLPEGLRARAYRGAPDLTDAEIEAGLTRRRRRK
jgi:hypothetical protein